MWSDDISFRVPSGGGFIGNGKPGLPDLYPGKIQVVSIDNENDFGEK